MTLGMQMPLIELSQEKSGVSFGKKIFIHCSFPGSSTMSMYRVGMQKLLIIN